MKKHLVAVFLALLLVALCCAAVTQAETVSGEAVELTENCTFRLGSKKTCGNLYDKKYTTYLESKKAANPALTVSCDTEMYGIYLCFRELPTQYQLLVDKGNGYELLCEGNSELVHAYYDLPGVKAVKVQVVSEKKTVLSFNEVALFGEGKTPSWVQKWQTTAEKADILFVVAHPEEEILYLGAAIPYYACEKERSVVVACLTYGNTTRRSELLNGLWSMGYRNYPIIGDFALTSSKSAAAAYKAVSAKNGQEQVQAWVTELYRRFRPEVVVAPDLNGEGGNGQRMMTADACIQSYTMAADISAFTDSAEKYGSWQVKKLYLHLYGDESKQIVFDWDQPFTSLNGRTGTNLAYYAYLYHKTQDDTEKTVLGTGSKYDNRVFGLYASQVGEDSLHTDFMENIPEDDLTEVATLDSLETWNTETFLQSQGVQLNSKGYLDEGEYIFSSEETGHWIYISPTLKVVITRKFDGGLPLTWFESEIWCDTEAGELMQNIEYDAVKRAKVRVDAAQNALEHHTVFAVNGDYYTYRVGSKNGRPVGIEIRNGEVYYDDHYEEEEKSFFPNLDTLAFYRNGLLQVAHSYEKTAADYLAEDAYLVFSFGPYLIRDGELSEWVLDYTKTKAKNPRHAFGMIEEGHYIDIMCEGRLGSRSEGVTMTQLAMLCQSAGCRCACNLDGGQTAVVIFMGKQLNKIGKYDGKTSARPTCEILGIGTSEQVGSFEVN